METWETIEISAVISKAFIKLKKVIYLINSSNGGNDVVENGREKEHVNVKFNVATNAEKKEQI